MEKKVNTSLFLKGPMLICFYLYENVPNSFFGELLLLLPQRGEMFGQRYALD